MRRLLALLCCAGCFGLALLLPAAAAAQTAAAPDVPELPLPTIPPTLRQPALRAAYLIEHFWDAMDFSDTARTRNRDFVEQHLVNFLSLFPHADPASHAPAVANLMQRAACNPEAYRLLAELAEKYLFETDSPLFAEETYLLFLEQIVASPAMGPYEVLRPQYQLEALRKNRPGMVAADFAYVTRDGEPATLHRTESGDRLLLIFYDATCAHCQEVMAELRSEPQLTQAVDSGRLEVLAICVDADREALLQSSADLPGTWMTGFEEGGIYENELYMLRSMPTLLLLDGAKRVLLKNLTPGQLLQTMAE